MKIAIAHDYLNQYGGAERFLESLCQIFPDAPIYTLFYDEEKTLGRFRNKIIKTSPLNYKFIASNHRAFIPLFPLVSQKFNVTQNFDIIISSTAGYAKGFNFKNAGYHISYCHTPLRYAWEAENYLLTHPLFQNKPAFRVISKLLTQYLRNWDFKMAQRPNVLIANSTFVAQKIKKFYQRDSKVIHPGTALNIFYPDKSVKSRDYFLALGRFLHYKKFDLVINTFNDLKLPLKIAGSGPEKERLKRMIKSENIEFVPLGENDEELRTLYSGAKALIFPQVEDFGLVAVESIACGTPVIAYRGGGAREIVEEEKSGIFFNHQRVDDLTSTIARFNRMKFNPTLIKKYAKKFSVDEFKNKFLEIVNGIKF